MPYRKYPRGYFLNQAFEAWIAAAAAFGGAVYLISPEVRKASAVNLSVGGLSWAWSVLYCVSGITILVSLWRQSVRWEVTGLCLFIVAVLINSIALFDYRGLIAVNTAFTFTSLAAAGIIRVIGLWRLHKNVTAGRDEG